MNLHQSLLFVFRLSLLLFACLTAPIGAQGCDTDAAFIDAFYKSITWSGATNQIAHGALSRERKSHLILYTTSFRPMGGTATYSNGERWVKLTGLDAAGNQLKPEWKRSKANEGFDKFLLKNAKQPSTVGAKKTILGNKDINTIGDYNLKHEFGDEFWNLNKLQIDQILLIYEEKSGYKTVRMPTIVLEFKSP